MKDVIFVIAGYGAVLGGLGIYTLALLRRLAVARRIGPHASPPNVSEPGDDGRA